MEKSIPTSIRLPDFDDLIRLAQTDPEQLSQLRQAMVQQHIAQRSDEWQPRLVTLQSHIERLISTGKKTLSCKRANVSSHAGQCGLTSTGVCLSLTAWKGGDLSIGKS